MISNLGEQEGEGLFTREAGVLPPAARKLLSQVGSEQVKTFKLVRTPLSSSTRFLLNIATLGQYEKALKDINVDKFFHLRAIINDTYSLEKNEVIRFYKSNRVESGAEVLDVPIPQNNPTTIQEMMDKTKAQMGDDKFTSYNAQDNNCGVFLNNVLSANGWLTSQASNFTLQKTNELFSKFPSLSKMLVNLGTKLGAVASRVIEGEGNCQCGGQDDITEIEVSEIEDVPFPEERVNQLNQQIAQLDNELMPLIGQAWMDPTPALAQQITSLQNSITALTNERNNIIQQNVIQPVQETNIQQIGTGFSDEYGDYNFQLKKAKLLF